ncbi:MAG: hypothetical protein ABIJ08_00340, partial [Nanoarchaeota archaeon]
TRLNLANVTIINSGNSIVIKGIDLTLQGLTKAIYINRTIGSDTVCIFDNEEGLTAVVGDCSNGVKVTCDGTNGPYACTKVNSDKNYKISGLNHSTVREYSYSSGVAGGGGGGGGGSGGGCYESWDCTPWTICDESRTQTRSCTDVNGCGTETSKPAEERSCTYFPPSETTEEETATTGETGTPTGGDTGDTTGGTEGAGMEGITGAVVADSGFGGLTGRIIQGFKNVPSVAGGIFTILVILIFGIVMYLYVYKPRTTAEGLFGLAANSHKKAEQTYKAGNTKKAENLYNKAQTLREEGEKKLK